MDEKKNSLNLVLINDSELKLKMEKNHSPQQPQ